MRHKRTLAPKEGGSHQIDDLRYSYYTNSNQLKNVTDIFNLPTSTLGDFKTLPGHTNFTAKDALRTTPNATPAQFAAASTDYTYDANGNLDKDENKNIQSISYNILNLPQVITLKNGKGTIEYLYDAAGTKLSKTVTEYVLPDKIITTTTTYMAGFVYESKTRYDADENNPNYTDKLQYLPHEEGRIRYNGVTQKQLNEGKQPTFCYDYFIKDHLGNIRMVLTDEGKEDKYPAATLETNNINTEKTFYTIPDAATVNKTTVSGYPTDNTTDPNSFIQKLKGNETKVGSSIVLKVMSGDHFNIKASSWYKTTAGQTPGTAQNIANALIEALTNSVASAATAGGHALTPAQIQETEMLSPGISSFLNDPNQPAPDNNRPRAFLNWILVDEQFQYVAGGAEQTPQETVFENSTANAHVFTHVLSGIPVTKNGYLYVYVSNESTNIPVFFDNLQVTHYKGTIFEETHYNPWGMVLQGISSRAADIKPNKIKYNGKEEQREEFSDGSGLEWIDYGARMLDNQLGRFTTIDPLADYQRRWSTYAYCYNNPLKYIDPTGMQGEDPEDKQVRVRYEYNKTTGETKAVEVSEQEYQEKTKGGTTNLVEGNPGSGGSLFFSYRNDCGTGEMLTNKYQGERFHEKDSDEDMNYTGAKFVGGSGAGEYASGEGESGFETAHHMIHYTEMFFTAGEVSNASKTFGIFGGKEYWVGKNLKVYSQSWGGNGWTGGRNLTKEFAEGMGKVAKPLGVISSAMSVGLAVHDFRQGHYKKAGVHTLDAAMGLIGTFCGPVGWAVSGLYFVSRFWWGDDFEDEK